MNTQSKIPIKLGQSMLLGFSAISLAVSLPVAAQENKSILIDGSSAVYPISQKVVEEYQATQEKQSAQASKLVTEVGYVPLPEEAYHIDKVTFHQGEVGTVFEGKSQFNLTISELLRKQAQF